MKKIIIIFLLTIFMISLIGCNNKVEEELVVSAYIHVTPHDGSYMKFNSVYYSKKEGRDFKEVSNKYISDVYDADHNYIHTKIVEEYYLNDRALRARDDDRKSYTVYEPQTLFVPNIDDMTELDDDRLTYIELSEDEKNKVKERVTKLVDEYPY
jgi:hypothetical protein